MSKVILLILATILFVIIGVSTIINVSPSYEKIVLKIGKE